jgi:hypothetical protein
MDFELYKTMVSAGEPRLKVCNYLLNLSGVPSIY